MYDLVNNKLYGIHDPLKKHLIADSDALRCALVFRKLEAIPIPNEGRNESPAQVVVRSPVQILGAQLGCRQTD